MKPALSSRRAAINGFTFVEVFAAMVFLAILIPAISEALKLANRTSEVAERGTVAGELAENKMNEMLAYGMQSSPQSGGNFGTDWPGYSWTMDQKAWDQDKVNVVTQMDVEVFYPVQGEQRSFRLTTLVSGSGNSTSQSQSESGL